MRQNSERLICDQCSEWYYADAAHHCGDDAFDYWRLAGDLMRAQVAEQAEHDITAQAAGDT